MFEIDEQKLKLLKMMESLLKTGNASNEEVNRYKDIVTKIDSESFNKIKDMINNIANHNHTLNEELKLLEEVNEAYEQLELIRCRFKNVYEIYLNDSLDLTDVEILKIEQIRNRINAIRGYLLNTANIDKYKDELSKLNNRLIEEDKKSDFFKKRIAQCDEELEQNFLNAEGRIQDGDQIKYTSIFNEYMESGINIRDIICNE